MTNPTNPTQSLNGITTTPANTHAETPTTSTQTLHSQVGVNTPIVATEDAHKRHTLELLAEKPEVTLERVVTGNLKLSKKVKTQTVNVPVTLTQEVLVIEYAAHPQAASLNDENLVRVTAPSDAQAAHITINGETKALGEQPIELVISQQVANVSVQTLVAENVRIETTTHSHEQAIPITLRHEELVTEEVALDNPTVISSQKIDDVNYTR